jgi:hypothetical protein
MDFLVGELSFVVILPDIPQVSNDQLSRTCFMQYGYECGCEFMRDVFDLVVEIG